MKATRSRALDSRFRGNDENGTFFHVVIPAKAGIQEKDDFFNGLLDATQ